MNTTQDWMEQTLGQLVTERPGRASIFESLGLDYCCGGRRRLDEACIRAGIDPGDVVIRMEEDLKRGTGDEPDPARLSLTQLCDRIEMTYHARLRQELPLMMQRAAKVSEKHGPRDPRLMELHHELTRFADELEQHMRKEERILFPSIRALEAHDGATIDLDLPIRRMMAEHDDAGASLEQMRRLSDDFTPPASACMTHRTLFEGLAELEREMHRHVHAENNILFPRALARFSTKPHG